MKLARRAFCLSGSAALAVGFAPPPTSGAAPVAARGLYVDPGGRLAAIGGFHEFGEGDFLFDYAGHRAGRLLPDGASRFRLLSTFAADGAPVAELEVDSRGLVLEGRRYRRVPVRRDPFVVRNRGVALHGETVVREDRPPRGAIVLVYGSGPGPKEALDFWAFPFVAAGWRVAVYDKRGSGRSGGDWRLAGLETLAGDAGAVVAHVRGAPAGGRPLGIWGASQGGWIAPQLGALGAVDFIILHAGAAVTPAEQILGQVRAELAAYRFPPAEIAKAEAYYALDTEVSRGRRPWADIDAAFRAAQSEGAEWLLGPPAAADAPERVMIRLMADFDPEPHWRANRAPVLAIFGGKDVIVPPEPSRTRLRAMMPNGVDLTVSVLPEANHLGLVADSGVRAEYPRRTRIDPGYFPAIQGWTDTHGGR